MFQKLIYIWQNRSAYIKAYLWPLPKFRREIVVMIDGVHTHGGLGDRLKFVLSVYSYCKEHCIPFKIYWTYPCQLLEILQPCNYDWRIDKKNLSYSHYDSKEICLWAKTPIGMKQADDSWIKKVNRLHISTLDTAFNNKRTQYHLYGNVCFVKDDLRMLFEELFKQSPYMTKKMASVREQIPEPYEAITLRFQQLLGDFEEGKFPILSKKKQTELVCRCKEKIKSLHSNQYFLTKKILVTSDSPTFLGEIAQLPFVYTIPGKMEHMDFTHNEDLEMNTKSFVDLFMLSKAQRITLLVTGQMYRSGFPSFAAEIGGIPFEEIIF